MKVVCIILIFFFSSVNSFSNSLAKYTVCMVRECCNNHYIIGNFTKLKEDLDGKLYGQHIAKSVVLSALLTHWYEEDPQKALTISLHGWPGSGKNYITKFIIESIYKKGYGSKYVHHIFGRIHFPSDMNLKEAQNNLKSWIKSNVTECERSLFIFDEVDKMPNGLMDVIKPFIDYYNHVDGVDYRRSIFIFLSNTGAELINNQYMKLWQAGVHRNNIHLTDFEKLIKMGAFNEKGAFYQTDAVKNSLIDHYVPFLPMERQHLELCIKDQFMRRKVTPEEKYINETMEVVDWGPAPENLFSKTGCKGIHQKVAIIIQKYRLRRYHDEL